jgi:uncharacterized protein (UPF0261 family)
MTVLLIGTLDTKGAEFAHVRQLLSQAKIESLVLDAGVLGPATFPPDVSREQLFAAAGSSYSAVRSANDRGKAITLAASGAARLTRELYEQGRIRAVMGLGGSAGTTIATAAMRALPFGMPKLMVSTMASGQVRPYVGVRDILMMHSVVDISGINRISRVVLANAVGAMVGMLQAPAPEIEESPKPLICATMFGVTTSCVEAARSIVESAGNEVLVFHATGTGGQTMESFIRDGIVSGVLDITTTELADELVGGVLSAGPDRLTAAALMGVPQVIAPGAIDMVNFGAMDSVPERFRQRRLYAHNPSVTLMRTTPQENDALGREIAHKASASRGQTTLFVPLRGMSALDREGQPFWWPEADQAFYQSIRNWIGPNVKVVELDLHINDGEFAEAMAKELLELMRNRR